MTPHQIVRAWKDADYGAALSLEEGSLVPPHPVGAIDLADDAIGLVAGGSVATTEYLESLGCCRGITQSGYCDITAGFQICTTWCFTIFWTGFC